MLNKNQLFTCMMIGCIGNDSYGDQIQSGLKKAGVVPLLEISKIYKSSRFAVAIDKKERWLLPNMRASVMLSFDFIIKQMNTIINDSYLLIEGYLLVNKFDIIKYLSEQLFST